MRTLSPLGQLARYLESLPDEPETPQADRAPQRDDQRRDPFPAKRVPARVGRHAPARRSRATA